MVPGIHKEGAKPPLHVNCSELVSDAKDSSPIRSAQAAQSVVARHVAGLQLVEIGTRNGDGMACFAHFARTAAAVEMDPHYCNLLSERSKAPSAGATNRLEKTPEFTRSLATR